MTDSGSTSTSTSGGGGGGLEKRRVLTLATVNKRVVDAHYAVRSEIVLRADQLQEEHTRAATAAAAANANATDKDNVAPKVPGEVLEEAAQQQEEQEAETHAKRPFKGLIPCNIGNPHLVGQKPLSFLRQVLSICMYPELLKHTEIFPNDAIERARRYLDQLPGGVGAYSNSQGIRVVRQEVAEFIRDRDNVPCTADNVFLTSGASGAVKMTLQALIRDSNDGILIPVPQYPLYSSTITLNGGQSVGYFLDESLSWNCHLDAVKKAYDEATARGVHVRAMVVINPSNPTGSTLQCDAMENIIRFCYERDLVVLADEVYQDNCYDDAKEFTSFYSVATRMGAPFSELELVSYHSISKGFVGECGLRGGYMLLTNFHHEVQSQLYKVASISLCANVIGQLAVGLAVNPPRAGQPSFALYRQERSAILEALRRRALRLVDGLNSIDGIQCSEVQGAMYCFPRVFLPQRAIDEAARRQQAPDTFYCFEMLEQTGIVTVPGSGFKQQPGTWHFRTTFLPSDDCIEDMIERIRHFHAGFMRRFAD